MKYLGLGLILVLATACTPRGKRPPPPPPARAVSWTTTMKSSRNIAPAIAEGARRAGCAVRDEKPKSFVAVCEAHVLFCKQRGREVVRGCGPPISYEFCKHLWTRVIYAIPQTDEE